MEWKHFEEGKTIGTIGSEGGIIFKDVELNDSARVSLEKNSEHAPYSITIGIYFLAVHTNFYSTLEDALNDFSRYKIQIEEILNLYEISEEKRDSVWHERHSKLLDELTN